jgi:hypothetical protein
MGHRLWEKVRCQHKVSAPSSSSAITHQSSKYSNPNYAYGHDGDPADTGCAITGGAFYDPQNRTFPPEYQDQYFFADFCNGWIRHYGGLDLTVSYPFASDLGRVVDLQAKDSTGDLYYLVRGTPGAARKISYTPPQ